MVASYTRVPPVRLLGPVCWRMLGGPPEGTLRTLGASWSPTAGGWEAGGWWPPILGCRL
jgi:hypothetical protein